MTVGPSRLSRERRPRRGVVLAGIIAATAIVALLFLLATPADWRTQLIANVEVTGTAATLEHPGDTACIAIPEVPGQAGRAEFHVQGASPVTGQVEVQRGARRLRAPVATVPVQGGIVRMALPAGAATPTGARVCLRSAQERDVAVLGSGATPALRLVGATQQTRLSQIGHELGRVGRAKGMPLRALGGWGFPILALAALGLALALVTRTWSTGTRRVTRGMWIGVALVGLLHAWSWAALTPAFQVPDEESHFQYVSYVADHGALPRGSEAQASVYSESQSVAQGLLQTSLVAFHPNLRPPWSKAADEQLRESLRGTSTDVGDAPTNATSQPPLYYLSVVAGAVGGGNALDVLARLRLLSGVWLAIAALAAVALIRTAVPHRPRWAVTGGLAVALFPLLGFLAGGVTPDVAMTALSLWVFVAAVRCWRDGVTPRNAALFAVLLVLLALTKLTALAIIPGALLIVLAAFVRDWRRGAAHEALRGVAVGVAAGLVPVALYVVVCAISSRSIVPGIIGGVASTATGGTGAGSLTERLSVIWQLFLPRLPFLQDFLPGTPLWGVWLDGLVGRFGYLDYGFTELVRQIIVAVWLLVVGAALWGIGSLVRGYGWRGFLRRHGPLLVGGAVAVVVLLITIGWMDFTSRSTGGPPFQQARYLLPGLPVALLALPLALRAFAPRLRPYVGVAMVGGAAMWVASALAMTLTRYYG